MADKFRLACCVLENTVLSSDIFSLRLAAPQIAAAARPGQFVMVACRDESRLLPRPISICEADEAKGEVRLVIRRAGRGTEEFAGLKSGESVTLTGPLGRGFPIDAGENAALTGMPDGEFSADGAKSAVPAGAADGRGAGESVSLILGGGIGIAPLLGLAKALPGRRIIVLGYRDETFMEDEFAACGELYIATESGRSGTRGNVLDAVKEHAICGDRIFACGPTPMLRAVKRYAEAAGTPCWLSLEERMACGIGACLGCVCRSAREDEHFHTKSRRVCTEGPVFESREVEL